MRKIWSVVISAVLCFGMCLGLFGCDKETFEYVYAPKEIYALVVDSLGNEYKLDITRSDGETVKTVNYSLEYIARSDTQVQIGLLGLYEKDGTPIQSELYNSQFEDGEKIDLSVVGTRVVTKACFLYYLIVGNRGNDTIANDCALTFRFTIQVKADKTLHKYVNIPDGEIPYEYFYCDMEETSIGYDLHTLNDIIGAYENTDDYEYGYLGKNFDENGEVLNYSFYLNKRQTQEDLTWRTHWIHSVDPNAKYGWEIYQYEQMCGKLSDGVNAKRQVYALNETDGVFSAGIHWESGASGWSWDLPSLGSDVIYCEGERDGYTFLSIFGVIYQPEHSLTTTVKETYKIRGNKIVAWLREEIIVNSNVKGEWRVAEYCIPLEGDIELVDMEALEEICST